MTLTKRAVEHPVTTLMVFAALFLLGIISLTRIGQELFPEISLPTAAIVTINPGVGPFDIEREVTEPIENAVAGISGVQSITSESLESASQVIVGFADGTEMVDAVADIRERLNEIDDELPDDAERPAIYEFNASQLPSLRLNIYTETRGIEIRELVENMIVPEVERIPGVGQAVVFGGREAAVIAAVDLDSLSRLDIPIAQVLQSFEGQNVSLPGGSLRQGDENLVLRTVGEFRDTSDIEEILIAVRGGVPVYLGDVAEVDLDYRLQEEFVETQGYDGVFLFVRKQTGYNTVDVNEAVLQRIDELRPSLPPSVQVRIQSNQAESVRESIGGVATAAWQGGILAVLVLLGFLRNFRSTFIISTVIPVAIVATFSLIDFAGMTLNMTSLMGITLAVGMFVDNAIVVLESIYRKQLAGLDPKEAAIQGADEVGLAITASTLTTMAVFVPMLFVGGLAGILFQDLSLTIAFSLFISLASARTLIPVMCARFLRVDATIVDTSRLSEHHELSLADVTVRSKNRFVTRAAAGIQRALRVLDDGYEGAITWALGHVRWVIGGAVVLLGISLASILLLGMEFLPEADEGLFTVEFETRVASSYSETARKAAQIEGIIRDVAGEEILAIASEVGDGGSQFGRIYVTLTDVRNRRVAIWDVVNEVNDRIGRNVTDVQHEIGIQGMSSLASTAGGVSFPIVIELAGRNLDDLATYAEELTEVVAGVRGTRNVSSSYQSGKPELQFRIDRDQAAALGLSAFEIASTIRTAYSGTSVSRYSQTSETYDVVVILEPEDRRSVAGIRDLFFVNRAGARIPIENVVTLEEDTGPVRISRKARMRVVRVQGALTGERALSNVMDDVRGRIDELHSPPVGIDLSYAGSTSEMEDSFGSMIYALLLAIALVYMVMASQFESLLNPLIVMFSVPFAVIGLVAALLVTNTTFNILAFVGAILLAGIVVNNAIVLIDYVGLLRRRGFSLENAIVTGGITRLKPILMTSLTTILGLLPMALGIGVGSEIQAPLGRAVVGGLATSTMITLILIPTIYWVIERRREARRRVDDGSGIGYVGSGTRHHDALHESAQAPSPLGTPPPNGGHNRL